MGEGIFGWRLSVDQEILDSDNSNSDSKEFSSQFHRDYHVDLRPAQVGSVMIRGNIRLHFPQDKTASRSFV